MKAFSINENEVKKIIPSRADWSLDVWLFFWVICKPLKSLSVKVLDLKI